MVFTGRRAERFCDVQLVLRDGTKSPCLNPKCKHLIPTTAMTCQKCLYRIRTRPLNNNGDRLHLMQDIYFRAMSGDLCAGVIVRIVDDDYVEVRCEHVAS